MQELRNENKGLFTILIPSYNHEEYVLDCLESIKRQSYSRIELIIIDDHSSDKTFILEKEWIDRNQNLFEKVMLIQNEANLGVVKTVNKGLVLSSGEYIIRLASDDCLLENAVFNIVEEYNKYAQYGMICFEGVMGYNYQEALNSMSSLPTLYGDVDNNKRDNLFQELYKSDFISAPGCVIRRETYLKLGIYDEKSWIDDWEYFLRIAKNVPVYFSKVSIVFFRQVPDSLSHSPSIKKRMMMNQGELYVLEKYKNDIDTKVSNRVLKRRVNLILREVLEWREDEFTNYVLKYMSHNKIPFTMRSYIKCLVMRIISKATNGN